MRALHQLTELIHLIGAVCLIVFVFPWYFAWKVVGFIVDGRPLDKDDDTWM